MSKKKSLGHNPLAYSTRRHASFDFITPSKDQRRDEDAADTQDHEKVNKVTASYYLEEPLVNKLRDIADQKEISYSALVNDIIKDSLKDYTS